MSPTSTPHIACQTERGINSHLVSRHPPPPRQAHLVPSTSQPVTDAVAALAVEVRENIKLRRAFRRARAPVPPRAKARLRRLPSVRRSFVAPPNGTLGVYTHGGPATGLGRIAGVVGLVGAPHTPRSGASPAVPEWTVGHVRRRGRV